MINEFLIIFKVGAVGGGGVSHFIQTYRYPPTRDCLLQNT